MPGPIQSVPKRMWTIGYEGHSPESLVGRLRDAGVERLVDIRELPLSRKPGFSKTALAAGLAHLGIGYTHLRALGTPRAVRHAYKAGGTYEEFRAAYLAHVEENAPAVKELEAMARKEKVALFCVEKDVGVCHRGVLADVLEERGWKFTHL